MIKKTLAHRSPGSPRSTQYDEVFLTFDPSANSRVGEVWSVWVWARLGEAVWIPCGKGRAGIRLWFLRNGVIALIGELVSSLGICVFSMLNRPSSYILQLFLDPRDHVEDQIHFSISSTMNYIPPINSIIQNMLQFVTEFLNGKIEEFPVTS
jgi:hypothetical protein